MTSQQTHRILRSSGLALVATVLVMTSLPETSEARPAISQRSQLDQQYLRRKVGCQIDRARLRHGSRSQERDSNHQPAPVLSDWLLQSVDANTCTALNRLLTSNVRGPATFDADGTLWREDVGEGFFTWMLRNKHYPAQRRTMLEHSWQEYKAGRLDGERMYELMATGMAGMEEKHVRKLAERYFDKEARRSIYQPMAALVGALRQSGFAPWIVSGSPVWVVAAGARHLGIPSSQVIGLSVKVVNGRLTDEVVRPVPWKDGKAQRIMSDIRQVPVLAAGNSSGDVQMLKIASELTMVVNPDRDILPRAQAGGWHINNFGNSDTLARYLSPEELARIAMQRTARPDVDLLPNLQSMTYRLLPPPPPQVAPRRE